MGDLDCGDCDCKCDDCSCDCKCDDCGCNCDDCACLDGCCTGETNVILCCFLPSSNNTRPERNRSSTSTDCSFCCCCFRDVRNLTSPKSSKKTKRKGFCSRLRSCFRTDPSPPSSPPRAQPVMELPPVGYKQDGRYPMKDGPDNVPPMGYNYNHDGRYPMNEDRFPPGYEEHYRNRAGWEELGMPPRGHLMDGKWSRPVMHGDKYGGHL